MSRRDEGREDFGADYGHGFDPEVERDWQECEDDDHPDRADAQAEINEQEAEAVDDERDLQCPDCRCHAEDPDQRCECPCHEEDR